MKATHKLRTFLPCCASLLAASSLQAAILHWDATPGVADGTSDGGDGTWDTTTSNWDDGSAYQAWINANNDTAVFGGNAGAVAIDAGGVTVGGLTFDTTGYTLDGGAITFGAAGDIAVNTAATQTATIASEVAGGAGLSKTGAGILQLTNAANSFSGDISVVEGILRIGIETNDSSTRTLGGGNYAGNISIAAGAIFDFFSTATQEFSGVISGDGNLQFRYSPTITLSGDNTYTGRTSISGRYNGDNPVLKVTSMNSVVSGSMETGSGTVSTPVASSSLGVPGDAANGTIDLGLGSVQAGAELWYSGLGETTDRVINIVPGGASTKRIRNDGGPLVFTSTMTMPNTGWTDTELQFYGDGDVTLQGSNVPGKLEALIKKDAGTLSVSGPCEVWDRIELHGGTLSVTGEISDGGIYYPANSGFISKPGGVANQVTAPDTSILAVGMIVSGPNFQTGTHITEIIDATTIEISANATGPNNSQDKATVGVAGSLGIAPATPGKLHWIDSATLQYNGPDDSTNRGFMIHDTRFAIWEIASGITLEVSGNTTATTGKLTKEGDGTLILSGSLLHTGSPNLINAGTLLIDGDSSAMTGAVEVATGANFGGIGTIGGAATFNTGAKATFTVTSVGGAANSTPMTISDVMTFNDTQIHLNLPANLPNGDYILAMSDVSPVLIGNFPAPAVDSGSYGAGGSGAISLIGNHLVLTVSGVAAGGDYASWASNNGIPDAPFDGDSDNDGISNGIEYALGLSPTVPSQSPGTLSGNTITFTKGADAKANGDVDWIIETSENLVNWSVPESGLTEDADTIAYTFPAPTPVRQFARFKAVMP